VSLGQEQARRRLDEVLMDRVQLSIMAALYSVDEAEVSAVSHSLGLNEPVLLEQIACLTSSGHVVRRTGVFRRWPRTWLRLSARGRAAYLRHLAALREIAAD
jgi:hypothetical protein